MIKYLIPFSYFYFTRIKSLLGLVFLLSWEIIPNLIILILLNKSNVVEGSFNFIVGYFIFIAFYELGYIMNDTFSMKKETDGRNRMGEFIPSNAQIGLMIAVRLSLFLSLSWYAGFWQKEIFWLFYFVLGFVFYLHNMLKNRDLKVLTFVNLAIFRFFAPCIFFISFVLVQQLLYPVLLFYVLYRTLSYMDSKGLLNMKSKESDLFKVGFYTLFIGISIVFSLATQLWLPIVANFYFLFWALGLVAFRKVRT